MHTHHTSHLASEDIYLATRLGYFYDGCKYVSYVVNIYCRVPFSLIIMINRNDGSPFWDVMRGQVNDKKIFAFE